MDLEGDLLLAIAAAVTAIGGCLMAYAGILTARKKGEEECEDRLEAIRHENELLGDQLHELRMKH